MRTLFSRGSKGSAEGERAALGVTAKRPSFSLPWVGFFCLVIALGLLVIGVTRRHNLLMLLGDLLVVIVLWNLLAAGRSLRGLQVRRRFDEWLFARTPCVVEIQVSNPDQPARLGLRIDEEGPDVADSLRESSGSRSATALHAAAFWIDCLPVQGSVSWRRQVMLPRRGCYKWGAVQASSGYPFGLVGLRRRLTAEETVTVFPRLGWLHRGRFLRHLRDLSVQPRQAQFRYKPRPHPAAQAEFHGLRSYRSGDSPRLIHWRTSARRGELMVREFEDEPSDNLLLVVDPVLPAETDYCGVSLREQFEEMISLTASICWEWCRRRDDRLVLATATAEPLVLDGRTGPIHARRILECLAVLECRPGPVDGAVVRCLQAQRLPAAVVVVVALGRSALAEPLRRALRRHVHCLDATCTDRFDFYAPPTYYRERYKGNSPGWKSLEKQLLGRLYMLPPHRSR
jgi:uncharacterized protein (DUF58 family)